MNKIISALKGAIMVLEAGEEAGLPMPTYLSASSYIHQVAYWHFDTLTEVQAWADFLEVPVRTDEHEGNTHHNVRGSLFEQEVSITFIEREVGREDDERLIRKCNDDEEVA